MKTLFLLSTLLFWLAAALFAWLDRASPPDPPAATVPVATAALPPASTVSPPPAGPASATPAAGRRLTLAEVARHARPDDCWMAIDGSVYDFTAYLPRHPSEPEVIEIWCGSEASEAYRTKTRGRPHSAAATRRMADYRLGALDTAAPPR
jgi:hypothetical protein